MKRKIAGLYDPYLDSMGGGERHVLSMLEVFEKEADFDSVVFWDEDYSERIKKTLNLTFDHLSFEPNIFKHSGTIGKLNKLNNLDLFIYVTDGSYFFSTAKKNYIFCMVPKPELFNNTVLNVLKTRNFSYICNSEFTQSWLKNYGGNAEFTGQQIQELDAFYPIITQLIEAGIQRQKLGHIMSLSVFTTFARRYLEEHAGENLVMFAHMLRDFLADFQGEVISQKERGFIQLNPDAQKTRTKEVQDTIASAIDDILQS
jgi:hypothetical protein